MTNDNNTNKQSQKKKRPGLRGKYKVIFKGHLLPGFNKQQVVDNIARLTKVSAEKIEQKFFSGKIVIIRRAHEQAYAQKLQRLFTEAGIEVLILKDPPQVIEPGSETAHKPEKASKSRTKTIAKKHQQRKLSPGIKLFIVMLIVFVLLVTGFNLWNKYALNLTVPEEVAAIEQSLANKKLLFLAHINIQQLSAHRDLFLDDTGAFPGKQSALVQQLIKTELFSENISKNSLQQMISAAYLDQGQFVSQSILLGHFSPDTVKKFLVKNYHAEVLDTSKVIHLRIGRINPKSCEHEAFMEVAIEAQRILISSDGYLQELQQILSEKTASEKTTIDLSQWQLYRQNKLLSLAVFVPEEAKSKHAVKLQSPYAGAALPLMMAQGMIRNNAPMDSVFASIALQWLPSSALLDVTFNSRTQSWLQQSHKELSKQLQAMQDKSAGLTHLQVLLNKIGLQQKTQANNGQLIMTLVLDNDFKQSLEQSVGELAARFFSLESSSSLYDATEQNVTQRLDENPLKFRSQYAIDQLPAFNEALDKFFQPAWIEGPFALAIDELLLESHEDGDQLILQLRGKAQNIENIADKQVKIRIDAVQDKAGENLMLAANCGQTAETAYFNSLGGQRTAFINNKAVHYNELEVRRKVKLKKGIGFSQVVSLSGEIELNIATRTQSLAFAKIAENLLVNEYDTRLLFKPSNKDTIAYTLSGEQDKVLVVRALNDKKQYLSRISRSSMDNLLGTGSSVTEKYQGEIAYIEVVYATQQETMTYPFLMSKFPPYPTDNQWKYEHEAVTLSSLANWNKKYQGLEAVNMTPENKWNGALQAQWHNGPLNIALFGLRTSKYWGTKGLLVIKSPLIDELRHNLSALEVFIREPQSAEDTNIGRSWFYQLKANGFYMNGDFVVDKDKPWLEGQLSFALPYKNAAEPLQTINGDIIIHLPLSMHSSSYTDMTIGAQWQDAGVQVKIVRLGNEIMEFAVTANRDRLLQITLMDSNKQRISTADIRSGMGINSGDGNIIVNYHGIPVTAVLTVAAGQQVRRYPFTLNLQDKTLNLQDKNRQEIN